MSIEDAIKKFNEKQLSPKNRNRAKRGKPEQDTVRVCMAWFKEHGFSMHIVESRAVYNVRAGRYLNGQTIVGFLDSAGCTPDGIGCFVEFKAKGKLSTLREGQRDYMREKILKGCFSCVVDNVDLLKEYYSNFVQKRQDDVESAIAYLLDVMPNRPKKRHSPNNIDFF